ncbi:MAG: GNAT family N-acetyltransferase [Flavobacterium sp.]|uniref:GNAT family N-acetyltransferase n=1 Tax=Flavobacterium sp. TaxID=239 RepID=UPI0032656E07
MIIRKADINDIDQLALLFNNYRIFYGKDSDVNGAQQFLTERIVNADAVVFVAENEKLLKGFVQLYPLFSSTNMRRLWLLNDLFVVESQRGKGISVQLINCAKTLAKETESAGLMLETAKTNIIGNKLYPSTGFILDDQHNYYTWEP